ncbi:LysR substrate-binding domain-containing protein [Bradyrhizobium cenepequi]|uniref:LysR substrate-binding domain-containing protein n=1 Tax=Bradyrhizobium cenepequi TaxID=2821403 RepID=UPI001CE268EB|nr:LysR substrate-binding domain-containing protein [Bradyrhizobium cenepequi]MCA6110148.1 LysR family transcriptional regulator [Bradyrhizobium cenepequi]
MRRLPPLSALRAFESAARHGSFKLAAGELAVTPTAISHQIRSLEEHIGLPVFERQVRKVVLTEAGAQLYPVLRNGFDALETVLERLMPKTKRAQVTISATTAFTARLLVPRVSGFQTLHPDIDLQLHASDNAVDLTENGIDLAIRYGRGPYPGMTSEVMFADTFAPVVNPNLGVVSQQDLPRFPLIHFQWQRVDPLNPTWESWFAASGLPWGPSRPQLRFSDESHAIQAAVAGQGIALLSLALIRDELAAGRLVQAFGPTVPGHTYHLIRRSDRAPRAPTVAVMDWLRSEASAH